MDRREAKEIARQYAHAVAQEMNPDRIVLFGSTADGTRGDGSDIDIAIIFDKFEGDWIKASARLVGLCESISYDIEPVLCSAAEDRSGFVKEVLRTGEMLFERQLAIANAN